MAMPDESGFLLRMKALEDFRSRTKFRHDALVDAFDEQNQYVEKEFQTSPKDPEIAKWQWRFQGYGCVERTFEEAWADHDRVWGPTKPKRILLRHMLKVEA